MIQWNVFGIIKPVGWYMDNVLDNDYCCVYIHRCLKIRDDKPGLVFVYLIKCLLTC